MTRRRGYTLSYVRVEVRSHSPRLWGWTLCRDGRADFIERSAGHYACAEAAWEAGRAAHRAFEATAAAVADLAALAVAEEETEEAFAD